MIIGITGYAQSGKDTVAKILVEKYGFERRAFADKIRDMLFEINPMVSGEPLQIRVAAEGWEKAKEHPEVRRLLQKFGVAARNHLNENVWVNAAFAGMEQANNYVISDVRFRNEAATIKACGGELWRVERPGVGPINGHISEKEMDNFSADRTLLNSGSKEELEALVQLRLDSYLANKNI